MRRPSPHPLFLLLLLLATPFCGPAGCASSRQEVRQPELASEEREDEENEEKYRSKEPPPPLAWEGGLDIAPFDGIGDTIRFHIGSPLFLRLHPSMPAACAPNSGRAFFFDAAGSQIGWGFREVSDSLLLPQGSSDCERFVMLSSEQSNRIPAGTYSLKVLIFVDEHRQLFSDTLVLQAIRSPDGPDPRSYANFLLEQLLTLPDLLRDPETIAAVFAPGTPTSAESELYRAVVLARAGDAPAAARALESSRRLESTGAPLASTPAAARRILERQLRDATN